jgi:hypothetical protein
MADGDDNLSSIERDNRKQDAQYSVLHSDLQHAST